MANPHGITVAAGQIAARPMSQADLTLASLDAAIEKARRHKADLLVLPECAYPAYLLGSVESYRTGKHMSGETYIRWLAQRAADCRMHIVSGFVDDSGDDTLYNAAVLLDDHGREIGRMRKTFLWHLDHNWYAPGDRIRAFDTRLGRIGLLICADARLPELLATLAADGAELLAMPTCWVNGARQPGEFRNPQVDFLIEARAREFGLPIICADKSGNELADFGYVGQSRIVRADGSPIAEASPTGETVICAKVTPARTTWRVDQEQHIVRLLSQDPPVRPRAADLPPIRAAVIPDAVAWQMLDAGGSLLHDFREQHPDFLVAQTPNPDDARRLRQRAAELGIRLLLPPQACEMIDLAGGRAACLVGPAAPSFVTSRRMVLDGATVLIFWKEPSDLSILRTRAMENRVFVIAVNDLFAAIIEPDGAILSYASSESAKPLFHIIPLDEAADKQVAPKTDLFAERRPAAYRF